MGRQNSLYGRCSFARGEIACSAELFDKAATVRQEDFQSLMLLGQSLRMLGRPAEASRAKREGITRAERVLALNPLDGRALSLGSGALYDDGQTARALDWSRRALELYPDDMSALVNGACLWLKMGLKEAALALLAERVQPRLGQARLARERSGLRPAAGRPALPGAAREAEVGSGTRDDGAGRIADPFAP